MRADVLRLLIGADPSHLAVARSFVASSLRTLGCSEELVNDLRLAVSELATALILANQAPTIELHVAVDGTEIVVAGTGPLPPLAAEMSSLVSQLASNGLAVDGSRWLLSVR